MNQELPKQYSPKEHEDAIYKKWEQSGYFNPDAMIKSGLTDKDAPPFSIMLPPPNVTGTLHIGHAVMLALEDTLVRFWRMKGCRTLWLPGTDHAAIATQSRVEKDLYEQEKKTRHDLGRDEFINRVEAFAQQSHDTIVNQVKKMGASVDWSREAYTLDEQRSKVVRHAFKKMYDAELIYQADRIVNWDPKMNTTISDDEIDWVEEKTPLYYLKFGPFTIATARPETKFADKYVVMHPNDKRYAQYKNNESFEVEWLGGTITATVIKDDCIDMEFGTGVMTITPWHDATDFDIATRHNLEPVQVIDESGVLLPIAGEFAGMNIQDARPKIVEHLQQKGLLEKIDESYTHRIATNSRGGGVIEPQIKKQWWVNVNKPFTIQNSAIPSIKSGESITLKELMTRVVKNGDVNIVPDRFEKNYFYWIDNLRDWNISRQLWYGHRIPVWYKGDEVYCAEEPPQGQGWEQDPDTLDTWFSSGMWTFSTLGWPQQTQDFQTYHPTHTLETGYDILFFWVARMILMSGYLVESLPFKNVYLHGLVRDEKGRKMSKSLGNIVDPLDLIDEYGADATRLALLGGNAAGGDITVSDDKIKGYKHYINKVWNITRFVLMQTNDFTTAESVELLDHDKKLLAELDEIVEQTTRDIELYRFHLALEKLYQYTWHRFADVILEESKQILQNQEQKTSRQHTLLAILKKLLATHHPFMPFVTEVLWGYVAPDEHLLLAQTKIINKS